MDIDDLSKRLKSALVIALEALRVRGHQKFYIVAVGITKNKEIILGYPKEKTHPDQLRLRPPSWHYMPWVHAEQDLCFQARAMNATLTHIIVCRLHRKYGSFKLAKPCELCQYTISLMQPHAKIYYTTNEGTIDTLI